MGEVVNLERESITSLLTKSKGYIVVHIHDDGEVCGMWDIDPSILTAQDVLAIVGRLEVFKTYLGTMYNDLAENEDLVEL